MNKFDSKIGLTTCPPLTVTSGAEWINVEWSICDDIGVHDVKYYTLTTASVDIVPQQNLTYNPICNIKKCSFNQTLAKACVEYGVYLTLTKNDDTIVEYEPYEYVSTQEQR